MNSKPSPDALRTWAKGMHTRCRRVWERADPRPGPAHGRTRARSRVPRRR